MAPMGRPNTLVFVDFPTPDPAAAAKFYEEVFGWVVEPRPADVFYRIVPGGHFMIDDDTPSTIGNLHMGIFDSKNARPHPNPDGVEPREIASGRKPRTWILVGDDTQDRILDTAEKLGGTILWRNHYWSEFDGNCGAFDDPWGNTFVLWTKPGPNPKEQEGFTYE
jgi:predicted enzyme related to lactoylglutathione lyase